MSISFAYRLHLRSRLTLIRLTLIRKPWSIGGQVFHLPYRYLCLHFLFWTLQHALQHTFNADQNALLPPALRRTHSFGGMLNARSLSMPDRSTSELLRTL
jgi:hypothetical protein